MVEFLHTENKKPLFYLSFKTLMKIIIVFFLQKSGLHGRCWCLFFVLFHPFSLWQKKDVHMLRFIQEVNTTTRSCALWDLEAETDYIVHVQSISVHGTSPPSETLRFRTPKEAERQASKSKDTHASSAFPYTALQPESILQARNT